MWRRETLVQTHQCWRRASSRSVQPRSSGASSLATDLGTGQQLEHALRSGVLAVRFGELAGASGPELADA